MPEVDPPSVKKREKTGWRKEWKMTWAPLEDEKSVKIRHVGWVYAALVPGLGKGHPEDEDELEDVVEWEPVNGAYGTLENAGPS